RGVAGMATCAAWNTAPPSVRMKSRRHTSTTAAPQIGSPVSRSTTRPPIGPSTYTQCRGQAAAMSTSKTIPATVLGTREPNEYLAVSLRPGQDRFGLPFHREPEPRRGRAHARHPLGAQRRVAPHAPLPYPAAAHVGGVAAAQPHLGVGGDLRARLADRTVAHEHAARHDEAPGALAARGEPALDEEPVDANPFHPGSRTPGARRARDHVRRER